jgi:hypothetical protein
MSQTITNTLENNYQQNYDKLQSMIGRKPEFGIINNPFPHDVGMSMVKTFCIIYIIILLSLLIIKPSRLVTYETDDGLIRTDVYALIKYSFIFSGIIFCVYKIP